MPAHTDFTEPNDSVRVLSTCTAVAVSLLGLVNTFCCTCRMNHDVLSDATSSWTRVSSALHYVLALPLFEIMFVWAERTAPDQWPAPDGALLYGVFSVHVFALVALLGCTCVFRSTRAYYLHTARIYYTPLAFVLILHAGVHGVARTNILGVVLLLFSSVLAVAGVPNELRAASLCKACRAHERSNAQRPARRASFGQRVRRAHANRNRAYHSDDEAVVFDARRMERVHTARAPEPSFIIGESEQYEEEDLAHVLLKKD